MIDLKARYVYIEHGTRMKGVKAREMKKKGMQLFSDVDQLFFFLSNGLSNSYITGFLPGPLLLYVLERVGVNSSSIK